MVVDVQLIRFHRERAQSSDFFVATSATSSILLFIQQICFLMSCRVSTPPETLDDLGDSLNLLEKLQGEQAHREADFTPLMERFDVLASHDYEISSEVRLCWAVW